MAVAKSEKEEGMNCTIQLFARQYIDANLYVQLLAANE